MQTRPSSATVRFGPYEADFEEGVLRKHGLRLKVQGKPLAVLRVLVDNAGTIVSRDALRHSLWAENTFVDFDKNLSTAVNKLRDALCDTANEARYIETVPRKGYRFKASVERIEVAEVTDAEDESSPAETREIQPPRSRRDFWTQIALAAVAVLAVAGLGGSYYLDHQRMPLNEKDTVVLADFDNSTGDAMFDDALKTALAVSLRQSPFMNVLPESQVAATLELMARPQNTRLTEEVARDLCLRSGSKSYLAEAIGRLGTEYVLELRTVNCRTRATLAEVQVTAASRDKVVEALGQAAVKLRSKLGESLATVQRFDVPLEQATTSSLEALNAYMLAQKTARENGAAQSLPYAQRAIELDPNFAMAYETAGVHYFNLAEPARANEYLTKAFQLRDHASERERLRITAAYYSSVTGELDKAAQTYRDQIAEYPRDIAAYNNLGIVFAEQGQYDKAAQVTRQGLRIEPTQVTLDENLAGYLLALQNFDEARQIIREQQPRKPDNYVFPSDLYALAFLASDPNGMVEQEKWFASKPVYENFGLALSSETEAFSGHLLRARELTNKAVDSALRSDRKETGAIWAAAAAQREAAFGNINDSKRLAAMALKISPGSEGVEIDAALAFASAHDALMAKSLSKDLTQRFSLDTQLQVLWLPSILAQLDLNRKKPAEALEDLGPAVPPVEFGAVTFSTNASGSCLFPAYLRGEVYLAAGRGDAAATEFQEILDHSGIVWNCWTGALANLGLARANALQSKSLRGADADAARVRAIAAYERFLGLWRDADPSIPIYRDAKAEYANLR